VAAFAVIVAARHLLEILTDQNPVYFPLQFFIHYPLAYIAPLLALVLLLHLFSGVAVIRVTRLMLYAWALTLLPPLVDLLAGRSGEAIGYLRLQYRAPADIFLNFFNPAAEFAGTTVGIRVETALACLLGALYVWLRRREVSPSRLPRLLRAAGAAFGVYIVALGFFTLPRLFEAAAAAGPGWTAPALYGSPAYLRIPEPLDVQISDRICILYLVPLCLFLVMLWLSRALPAAAARLPRLLPLAPAGAAAVLAAAGVAIGTLIRGALDGTIPEPAPVDLLAAAGLIGATVCAVWSAHLAAGVRDSRGLPFPQGAGAALALAAAALAAGACSGPAALTLLATAYGLTWAMKAAPLGVEPSRLLAPVGAGLAAITFLGTGAAWAVQADALALFPPRLAAGTWLAVALAALSVVLGRPAGGVSAAGPVSHRRSALVSLALLGAAVSLPAISGAPPAVVFSCGALALAALLPRWLGLPFPRLEMGLVPLILAMALAGILGTPVTRHDLITGVLGRPKFIIRQAMSLEDSGRVSEAVAAYRRVLEIEPDRPAVHTRLGDLLWQHEDDPAGAMEAFRQAIALDPSEVAARHHLALLLLEEDRPAEAAGILQAARRHAPRLTVLAYDHAEALSRAPDRQAEAMVAWREYLELSQGQPEERLQRIRARSRLRALESGETSRPGPSRD
jgi:tetratricopeptide (TPR) repeat protein